MPRTESPGRCFRVHLSHPLVDLRVWRQARQLLGRELQEPALTRLGRDLRLDDGHLLTGLDGLLLNVHEELAMLGSHCERDAHSPFSKLRSI
jgi:hypothetical protein